MRYIDADALIKKIYPMGIGDGKYAINAGAVKFAIDNAPTADVVPRQELDDALLVCELTRDRVRELEKQLERAKTEGAREVLTEIKQAFEKYGGQYGMQAKLAELEQRFGVIDCTKRRHFVGCESCRTGQVCGELERIEN